MTIGNIVYLKGEVYSVSGPYENGWYAMVQSISGNTVTLSTAAVQSMTSSVITEFRTYKNIRIEGFYFDMIGSTNGFIS